MDTHQIQSLQNAHQLAEIKRSKSFQDLRSKGYFNAIVDFFHHTVIESEHLTCRTDHFINGRPAFKAIEYEGMSFTLVIDTSNQTSELGRWSNGEVEYRREQLLLYADHDLVFTGILNSTIYIAEKTTIDVCREISSNSDDCCTIRLGSWGNHLVEALAYARLLRTPIDQNQILFDMARDIRVIDQHFGNLH